MDEHGLRDLYNYSQTNECRDYAAFLDNYCLQLNASNIRHNLRFLENHKLNGERQKHKRAISTVIELIEEWSKTYTNTNSFSVPWNFDEYDIYLSAPREQEYPYKGVRILWTAVKDYSIVSLRKYPENQSNDCDEIRWKITNRKVEVVNDSEY